MSRRWVERISALVFLIFLGLCSAARADTPGPSFDCAKANPLEAVICADPKLSADDRTLARLYAAASRDILDYGPSQQLVEQRKWLKERDRDCEKALHPMPKVERYFKSANDCLALYYDDRLKNLAVATLFRNLDLSLAVLRDKDPKAAPFYEAIYRYVTIRDRQKRATVVGPLIQSAFVNGRAIGANSIADAVKSDVNFSRFIAMDTTMMDLSMTIPCSALQRRPGLINILGPYFGGGTDGAIPLADCQTMLPPLPAMDLLIKAAWDTLPPCDYTIRFSTYRDFAVQEAAIRLHQPQYWRHQMYGPGKRYDAEEPIEKTFRRGQSKTIAAVSAQLSDYYVNVFKVEPEQARNDARSAIDFLLYTQFSYC